VVNHSPHPQILESALNRNLTTGTSELRGMEIIHKEGRSSSLHSCKFTTLIIYSQETFGLMNQELKKLLSTLTDPAKLEVG